MKALFDADVIVFRAGFAAERQQWFLQVGDETPEVFAYKREAQERLDELLPGKYSREEGKDYKMWPERYLEPLEHALHNVNVLVERCLNDVDCTEFDAKFYLSGKGHNFRHEIATTRPYKGNRDEAHRPTHEDAIRKYIREKWETEVTDGIEADDALGIAQTEIYGPQDSVIISIDKDLDQIPGLKYNFLQEVNYDVTDEEAEYKFCHQMLTGDSTDNIPGLPKVGKATANKALENLTSCELREEVVRQYASRSGKQDWWEYLQEQAALVWILKSTEPYTPFPEGMKAIGGDDYEEIKDAVLF
jgi:hypothetical protein